MSIFKENAEIEKTVDNKYSLRNKHYLSASSSIWLRLRISICVLMLPSWWSMRLSPPQSEKTRAFDHLPNVCAPDGRIYVCMNTYTGIKLFLHGNKLIHFINGKKTRGEGRKRWKSKTSGQPMLRKQQFPPVVCNPFCNSTVVAILTLRRRSSALVLKLSRLSPHLHGQRAFGRARKRA